MEVPVLPCPDGLGRQEVTRALLADRFHLWAIAVRVFRLYLQRRIQPWLGEEAKAEVASTQGRRRDPRVATSDDRSQLGFGCESRFERPEDLTPGYLAAPLTERANGKILGENLLRLHGMEGPGAV